MMLAQCYQEVHFDQEPARAAGAAGGAGVVDALLAAVTGVGGSSGSTAQPGGGKTGRDEGKEREFIKELFVDTAAAVFSVHNFCRVGSKAFNSGGDK